MLPAVDILSKYVTDFMELSGRILNISVHIRIMGISDITLVTLAVGSFGVPASDDFNSVLPMENVSIHIKIILWGDLFSSYLLFLCVRVTVHSVKLFKLNHQHFFLVMQN